MPTLNAVINVTDHLSPALKAIQGQLTKACSGINTLNQVNQKLNSVMNNGKGAIEGFGKSAKNAGKDLETGTKGVSKFSDGIKNLLSVVGGMTVLKKITSTISGSLGSAINRLDTMETFERKMTMITGSSDTAKDALDQLRGITKGTAYGLDVAAQGVQNFVTRGMSTQDAVKSVDVWSNAVSAFGQGTNDELSRVMDAIGKMRTKGKVDMEQMSRLFDIGLNPIEDYAKATGSTANEVQTALTKGSITAEQFFEVVEKAYQEGTNGVVNVMNQGKEAGKTWTATFDNMRAACTRGTLAIVEGFDNAFKAIDPDRGFKGVIAKYGVIFENITTKIGGGIEGVLSPALKKVVKIFDNIAYQWNKSKKFFEELQRQGVLIRNAFIILETALSPIFTKFGQILASEIIPKLKDLILIGSESFLTLANNARVILEPLTELGGTILVWCVEKLIDFFTWASEISTLIIPPLFDATGEILRWLAEDILPVAFDWFDQISGTIADLVEYVVPPTFQWFSDNLDWIAPVLLGIVGTLKAYQLVLKGISVVQGVWNTLISAKNALDTLYLANALRKNGLTLAEVATTELATGAQIGLNTAMWACPVTWIIALIVGLIAIFALLWTKCEGFRNFWSGLWDGIKNVCSSVGDWLGNFFTKTIPDFFKGVGSKISGWWSGIKEKTQSLGEKVASGFESAKSKVSEAIEGYKNRVEENWKIAFRIFDWAKDTIGEKLSPFVDWLDTNIIEPVTSVFSSWAEEVKGNWDTVVEQFKSGIDFLKQVCENISGFLNDNIVQPFRSGLETVSNFISEKWQIISDAFNTAKDNVMGHVNNLINGINDNLVKPVTDLFSRMYEYTKEKWDLICEGFQMARDMIANLFDSLYEIFHNAVTFVGEKLGAIWQAFVDAKDRLLNTKDDVGQIFTDLWNSVTGSLRDLVSGIADFGNQALQKVKDFFEPFVEVGRNLIDGFISGITEKITGVVDKVKEIGGNVLQGFKDVFNINSPSKETDAMGGYLMAGMENGIVNNGSGPINAVTSRMNIVKSVMQSILADIIKTSTKQYNQLLSMMVSALNKAVKYHKQASLEMMNGLIQGIKNKTSEVLDATSALVTQLKQTFITQLGIHSPSVFGIYIGEMLSAGIMKGLEGSQLDMFVGHIIDLMKNSFTNGKFNADELVDYLDDDSLKVVDYLIRTGDITAEDVAVGAVNGFVKPLIGDFTPTYGFGTRNVSVGSRNHGGMDIPAPTGTQIVAPFGGKVSIAGVYGGYGNAVMIDHANGMQSLYGHMSVIQAKKGQDVTAGTPIGLVGSTGVSTGPHLHYEIRQNGTPIDPSPYWNGSASLGSVNTLAGVIQQAYNNAKGITGGSSNLSSSYSGSAGVEQYRGLVLQALSMLGLPASGVNNVLSLMEGESGGKNIMQQITDINSGGNEARGLMQVTPATFNAYKMAGYENIWDPLSNILASIRYQMARYGYLKSTPGYAVGTRNVPEDMFAMIHQGEAILPKTQNPYSQSGGDYLGEIGNIIGNALFDTQDNYDSDNVKYNIPVSTGSSSGSSVGDINVEINPNFNIPDSSMIKPTMEELELMIHRLFEHSLNVTSGV